MPDQLMIVQFPHPGPEHQPAGSWMPWNRGEHARKFLCGPGQFIANGRSVEAGEVCFWGEWEPQSTVERRFSSFLPGGPALLQRPYLQALYDSGFRQNTDPLVFGDRFLYSNCRQRNHHLRELAPGSLILFGSTLHKRFVLDTVLVVHDKGTHYSPATLSGVACPEWVHTVVFEPLRLGHGEASESFRLYRGRRYDDAGEGPFSFVPCKAWGANGGAFARPAIELDANWLNPRLTQSAKATIATAEQVRRIWNAVVDQVTRAGLALGVAFEPPPVKPGRVHEAQGTRTKC